MVSKWNLIFKNGLFMLIGKEAIFCVWATEKLTNRQLVFGLVLFLKRGRMESLLEEMHPEALPPFAWIRKHWRMSMMTFLTSLLPSRRPWVTGTLSSHVSVFFFTFRGSHDINYLDFFSLPYIILIPPQCHVNFHILLPFILLQHIFFLFIHYYPASFIQSCHIEYFMYHMNSSQFVIYTFYMRTILWHIYYFYIFLLDFIAIK